jgi:hypothetical protein
MDILGTNFSITLGSWRLRFCLALEDVDAPAVPQQTIPQRLRFVSEEDYARRQNAGYN